MSSMGPVEVVISLPFGQLLFQIHVPFVRQKLIELFLVRPVGSFDFSIELRGSCLDINMSYAFVLDVPVELGQPFVATISTKGLDSERELLDDVVGKVHGVLLRVAL